jgi:hypothetical protein
MAATSTIKSGNLQVPRANLYFEVRGSGPVLLMMPGGPADATTLPADRGPPRVGVHRRHL